MKEGRWEGRREGKEERGVVGQRDREKKDFGT